MRLLVCGDRNWTSFDRIKQALEEFEPTVVIEGEARGADSMARLAAEELGIPVERYPANWALYHRAAGPIRNKQMIVEGKPDMVIAFHSDLARSTGTKNMLSQALSYGIPFEVIKG